MTYSFDIEIAQEIGVDEAIMLQNIIFWLVKNKANGTNHYDGRYWTYNSHKALESFFLFGAKVKSKGYCKTFLIKM